MKDIITALLLNILGWHAITNSTCKVCAFGLFRCGPLDSSRTHSFAHLTLHPLFFGAYSVPGSCLKKLKAIRESYPGQLAESKALGKRWGPGREDAVLKGVVTRGKPG